MTHNSAPPTRSDVVKAARGYLNVPYLHCGRNRNGLDCAGLLVMVCRDLDVYYRDVPSYGMRPNGNFEKILDRLFRVVDTPESGDILLYWIDEIGVGQHAAIKTDEGIIHAHNSAKHVIETAVPANFENQFIKAYRLE